MAARLTPISCLFVALSQKLCTLQLNFDEEDDAKREPVKLPLHACS